MYIILHLFCNNYSRRDMNFTFYFQYTLFLTALFLPRLCGMDMNIFAFAKFLVYSVSFMFYYKRAWALFLSISFSFCVHCCLLYAFFCFKRQQLCTMYLFLLIFASLGENRNALHTVRDMPFHSILSNAHLSVITEKSHFVCRFEEKKLLFFSFFIFLLKPYRRR